MNFRLNKKKNANRNKPNYALQSCTAVYNPYIISTFTQIANQIKYTISALFNLQSCKCV